jgi:hypothetical protein
MARSYKRDSRGRFASTGGGGSTATKAPRAASAPRATQASSRAPSAAKARGEKARAATSTRAANDAVTRRINATGQTAVGGRLAKSTAAKYSGTAATKRSRAAGWVNAGHNQKEGVPGSRQGANFAKASPKGTATRRTRPARKIEPATLPGQKLQHYPPQPVNSPAASKKGPKKRPILDAIARPILRAMSGKKKRKG